MKAEILEIITQHKFDHISSEQALSELLDLFGVSNRSEQLVCFHPYSDVYQSETECYCEKCGKDLTQAN
jgi:hypothetical protein